jgi:hypothetical protein
MEPILLDEQNHGPNSMALIPKITPHETTRSSRVDAQTTIFEAALNSFSFIHNELLPSK